MQGWEGQASLLMYETRCARGEQTRASDTFQGHQLLWCGCPLNRGVYSVVGVRTPVHVCVDSLMQPDMLSCSRCGRDHRQKATMNEETSTQQAPGSHHEEILISCSCSLVKGRSKSQEHATPAVKHIRDRQTDRQRDRQTERDRGRERDRERETREQSDRGRERRERDRES